MQLFKNVFFIKNNINLINRNLMLDFIRGFAMILVLLHHCNFILGKTILLFHMPLFFIISGYTIYYNNKKMDNQKFSAYFQIKFKKFIIPYLLFEIIQAILFIIYKIFFGGLQSISVLSIITSILTCINTNNYISYGRLWFLPCMFISSLFMYFILKLFKSNKKGIFVLFLLLVLSFISSNVIKVRLPFTIDISFLSTAFMYFGYMIGNTISRYFERKNSVKDLILIIVLLLIFIICIKYCNPKMLMYINQYGNFIFSIICAVVGSLLFIILCKNLFSIIQKLRYLNNIIIWYSQNSLASFPIHLQVLSLLILLNRNVFSHFIFLFPATMILNIIIVNFINHYLPFLIQKSNKK